MTSHDPNTALGRLLLPVKGEHDIIVFITEPAVELLAELEVHFYPVNLH